VTGGVGPGTVERFLKGRTERRGRRTKKLTALAVAGAITFAGMSLAAAPAHACAGVECTINCIKRMLSGNPACPD
jgi:hypothetical protein